MNIGVARYLIASCSNSVSWCLRPRSKQQSVIQQLQARKGRLIVMCSQGDAASMCPNGASRVIEVPQLQDCLQPIINIVPLQVLSCSTRLTFSVFPRTTFASSFFFKCMVSEGLCCSSFSLLCQKSTTDSVYFCVQLLAYHLTVLRGLNVDQPRNLAKSVTTQ